MNPGDGQTTVADRYFSWLYGGLTADQAEDATAAAEIAAFDRLSHHRIRYRVVQKVHDRTFPVYSDGSTYTMDSYGPCASGAPPECEARKFLFRYEDWVARTGLCALAAQHDVDEIWVQSPPFLMTWENFMIGPTPGFDVNGPSYVTPSCTRHYVVHNPSYAAPPQAFLHIVGHRVEATMNLLTERFRPQDRARHWERFAAVSRYGFPGGVVIPDPPEPFCGNAHFPSNSQSHYDYGNPRQTPSLCADWNNFPAYRGTVTTEGCEAWGCSDNGWGERWLGALPHAPGSVSLISATGRGFAFPRDWWSFILDPDAVLRLVPQL